MNLYLQAVKKIVSTIFTLISFLQMSAQLAPIAQYKLPAMLNESSGLAIYQNQFYTHNDGGNPAQIHVLDSQAQLIKTYSFKNASNIDWEAMCINPNGDILIGDIGNNNNDRKDLAIYFAKSFKSQNSDTILVDTLFFQYQNQLEFPAIDRHKNFDCESFIQIDSSIYLFTKNRSNPYSGFSYLYQLPFKKGNHIAQLKDSIYTGAGPKEFDWITDAHFSSNTLWLLSHNFVLSFDSFDTKGLKNPKKITFDSYTQKEACAYQAPYLYVTDEKNSFVGGGNLYQYLVDSKFNHIVLSQNQDWYKIKNNQLIILNVVPGKVEIYDMMQRKILSQSMDINNAYIDLKPFSNQELFIYFENNQGYKATKIYIIP